MKNSTIKNGIMFSGGTGDISEEAMKKINDFTDSIKKPSHDWEQDTCIKCGDKDYLNPDKYCCESKLNNKKDK